MPAPQERTTIKVQSERAILAAVRLPEDDYDQRDPFGELRALAEQAGARVVGTMEQRRQRPEAGTYIGTGKIEELKALCEQLDATIVIFDHDLAPKQLANIEEGVGRKIVDRSELILDIFASRATTHEAQIQVELAQLEYTYPRLRAMWSHLERIVGAGGMMGIGTRGPGEQQLEIDRRLVNARKDDLRRRLREIHDRKRRMVQDRRRDYVTVGIVGYTNAGKSTLFNSLTAGGEGGGGGAYADDRLFATLVTRTREWDLAGGVAVMLSDTVGFVRNLPHHLIASFRATLEEATHADLLLIVLDVSDPSCELHYRTVCKTLDDLEHDVAELESRYQRESRVDGIDTIEAWKPPQRVVLLNKIDKLRDNRELLIWQSRVPDSIAICATDPWPTGRGHEQLRARVLDAAQMGLLEVELTVPSTDGKSIQRIETRSSEVLDRRYDDMTATLRVRIGKRQLDQLRSSATAIGVREVARISP
jgi:GTPase